MTTPNTSLAPTDVIEEILVLKVHTKGGRSSPTFADRFASLTFDELAQNKTAKEADVGEQFFEPNKRAIMNHAFALHRDALYSHASPMKLRLLGLHNAFRFKYEAARLGTEGNLT